MKFIVTLVLTLFSTMAFAADTATLVIPKIAKPSAEAAANDHLHATYASLWAEYEESIGKVTASVKEALEKQSEKAANDGELDLVEYWEGLKKTLADEGKLEWDVSPTAVVEWKKKTPKIQFPREFNESVKNAAQAVASAQEQLDKGYADLIKDYTKAKNVPRAKELREERDRLLSGIPKPSPLKPRRSDKTLTVSVRADNANWTEAVELAKGDSVMIVATGRWNYGTSGASQSCGADGRPSDGKAGLVGMLGEGPQFKVGAAFKSTADRPGKLYLRMDDASFGDNSGELSVTITVK